jgi:hypothetical protein
MLLRFIWILPTCWLKKDYDGGRKWTISKIGAALGSVKRRFIPLG